MNEPLAWSELKRFDATARRGLSELSPGMRSNREDAGEWLNASNHRAACSRLSLSVRASNFQGRLDSPSCSSLPVNALPPMAAATGEATIRSPFDSIKAREIVT